MSTVITTSTTAFATYGTRLIGTTSDGTVWAAVYDLANLRWGFWYSTDDGANWSENANLRISVNAFSLCAALVISDNDWLWFVETNGGSLGKLHYTTGAITSSYAGWDYTISHNENNLLALDMVVVKTTNFYTAVVLSYEYSGDDIDLNFFAVPAAGGTSSPQLITVDSFSEAYQVRVVMDWEHIGDGKTTLATDPMLLVAYRESNNEIRSYTFQVDADDGEYLAGSVSGQSIALDSGSDDLPVSVVADGSRWILAGATNGSPTQPLVYEYAYAGSSWSALPTSGSIPALSDGNLTDTTLGVLDDSGDFRLYAVGATSQDVKMTEYDRSGDSFSSWETIATTTALPLTLNVSRGNYSNGVHLLWTSGSSSPYDVVTEFDQATLDASVTPGVIAATSAVPAATPTTGVNVSAPVVAVSTSVQTGGYVVTVAAATIGLAAAVHAASSVAASGVSITSVPVVAATSDVPAPDDIFAKLDAYVTAGLITSVSALHAPTINIAADVTAPLLQILTRMGSPIRVNYELERSVGAVASPLNASKKAILRGLDADQRRVAILDAKEQAAIRDLLP